MPRILIAEDDANVRYFLRRVLSANHELIETENGDDALSAAIRKRPDLVITDLNMPGMNGDVFIRQLRESFPGIKIIAITGWERALRSVEKDVDGAFLKPMDLDELENAVRRLLDDAGNL